MISICLNLKISLIIVVFALMRLFAVSCLSALRLRSIMNYFFNLFAMKLICAVPSISMVSIILCRYFALTPSGLMMFKFRRFLMLLLHHLYLSRLNYIKFRFSVFLFKLVIKDDVYYVYQLKASRSGKIINTFDFADYVYKY